MVIDRHARPSPPARRPALWLAATVVAVLALASFVVPVLAVDPPAAPDASGVGLRGRVSGPRSLGLALGRPLPVGSPSPSPSASPVPHPDALAHPVADADTRRSRPLADEGDHARCHGHVLRPGLRPRRRDEPVRRPRPCARRRDRGPDPRRLLRGIEARDDRPDPDRARAAPRRLSGGVDRPALDPRARRALDHRRRRGHLPGERLGARVAHHDEGRRGGDDDLAAQGPGRRRQDAALRGQGHDRLHRPAGRLRDPPPARREAGLVGHVPRVVQGRARRELRERRRPARPRQLPARRRAGRDAGELAGRGAAGPGRRGPQLRGPPPPPGHRRLSTSTTTRARRSTGAPRPRRRRRTGSSTTRPGPS